MASSKSMRVRSILAGVAIAPAVFLGGCSVELQNRQAAQEVAQQSKPPGSVYTGWRVYQEKCLSCHGPAATGTANAPNLLPLVRDMGPRRFVGLVLQRYDWNQPATQTGRNMAAMDALIEQAMQRQGPAIVMPAWESEPRVNAHIMDLYAYLAARAQGTQDTGRPAP